MGRTVTASKTNLNSGTKIHMLAYPHAKINAAGEVVLKKQSIGVPRSACNRYGVEPETYASFFATANGEFSDHCCKSCRKRFDELRKDIRGLRKKVEDNVGNV